MFAKKNLSRALILCGLFSLSAHAMELSSPTVENSQGLQNAQIFNGWGCTGKNESPALTWTDIPKGTKSFALTMYDPDAPTGSGWWHWMMINIPANVHHLSENTGVKNSQTLPKGAIQLRNDFGYDGFGGACPPAGAKPHNYQITIYALNVAKLDIPANASPAYAGFFILQHKIGAARLTAPTNAR
ncbi:YbhB/YbcL family Raf kinase inhibitor-like protein [Edwardsiella piscicida]|nr:YbhB/YbcL family Raf kinase inhibitor-like protein [Edwardsiella piscicida]EKS7765861.1 YbhB/YbcL family Raf kinase inhibitor-like protein [Edwardsiella piscicida]EKS7780360.1 YbhB/YbcL family Raf kinase inhibitor-like protein [Edwardsiella piscicida]EKS7783401.1 YbhB/YbcL family Raf kinase inhibitor-like protein [Edwardsiella piscicida]UBU79846.1 YbhB/YbcL family Raf kinase inhibitor-like protein [Edwardsiella piscicida]UCQ23022.1 YbhB/YbcL family Raf kinase inhibitor-like protein [Edwards